MSAHSVFSPHSVWYSLLFLAYRTCSTKAEARHVGLLMRLKKSQWRRKTGKKLKKIVVNPVAKVLLTCMSCETELCSNKHSNFDQIVSFMSRIGNIKEKDEINFPLLPIVMILTGIDSFMLFIKNGLHTQHTRPYYDHYSILKTCKVEQNHFFYG